MAKLNKSPEVVVAPTTAVPAEKGNVRISLAEKAPVAQRPVMEDIKSDSNNITLDASGNILFELKAPGISEVLLSEGELREIRDRLAMPVPEGDSPAAVFSRTAREYPDGTISGLFSDAPRARTLTLTPSDRLGFVAWADGLLAQWPGFAQKFADFAAAKAAEEAANNAPVVPVVK